jgi:hypothetical protein
MIFDRLKHVRDELRDARCAIADVKIALRERISATEVKFDPNQPRVPQGTSTGGQWTSTGRGSGHKASARKPSPPPAPPKAKPPQTLGYIPRAASRTSLPLIAGAVGIQRAAGTYAAVVSGQSQTPFLHIPYQKPTVGSLSRPSAASRTQRPMSLPQPRHHEDDDCDEVLDREMAFCRKASFRFSRSQKDLKSIRQTCYKSALRRYSECLTRGGVSGIKTPLYTGYNYRGDGQ